MKLSSIQRALTIDKKEAKKTTYKKFEKNLPQQQKRETVRANKCQKIMSRMVDKIGVSRLQRKRPIEAMVLLVSVVALMVLVWVPPASPSENEPASQAAAPAPEAKDQPKGSPQVAQRRLGGLEPGDYIDEAGELEIMANQQQIPTAHLMAAAGHIVPENFFLPGGSVPALYSRLAAQQVYQQSQPQQQQQAAAGQQQLFQAGEALQQLASHVHARFVGPHKYFRPADLLAAASQESSQAHQSSAQQQQQPQPQTQKEVQQQQQAQQEAAGLIDFNSFNLLSQPLGSASEQSSSLASPQAAISQADLIEYLTSAATQNAIFEQQQQASQQQAQQLSREQQLVEQQLAAELAAIASHQQHQLATFDNSLSGADQTSAASSAAADHYQPAGIGPAYQIAGQQPPEMLAYAYEQQPKEAAKSFGQPTKSSSKEPSGMLKPLGNPKTISSPIIDFVTSQLPKTSALEKINDKLPQTQTPTVFSFSSSKDPMEKVKGVNQKKRNVMRQAEQLAKMMIKTINEKLGTNIGDQSDIPFLLSSIGPLGFAQNILTDPTLLVTLLNSAEKTYLSDVLPAPAKLAIRPVLNIFRVPNKKRDKANLSNIISFLASGGQVSSSNGSKHRQGMGVEKSSKNKSRR